MFDRGFFCCASRIRFIVMNTNHKDSSSPFLNSYLWRKASVKEYMERKEVVMNFS